MKSDQYYIDEIEQKILELVHAAIVDLPRPFSLVLSGGFDSGLLAAITKPDLVYSISFPYGPKYDEGFYRNAIIKHLGLEDKTKVIVFRKDDFLPNLEEAVKIMGEPVSHFSLAPLNLLMKTIKGIHEKCGCTTVLSGEGPDEYFGGYARQIIFDELKKLYEIPELRNYHRMIEKVIGSKYDLVMKYGEMMNYEKPDVGKYLDLPDPLQGAIGRMDMELGVIEKMEQKLAGAYGLNLVYPYINQAFAEYCYMLPDHLKIRNGVTKWVFREICKKYLPEVMWNRSKMGGPVAPVNQWIEGQNRDYDKTSYVLLQEKMLGMEEKEPNEKS